MARTRRYRRYYKKGKWSSNIKAIGPNSFNIQPQSTDVVVHTLVVNPPYESNSSYPVGNNIMRVKNVEVSAELETPISSGSTNRFIECCTLYLMYVPEGYAVTKDTPIQHPEWIMAYQFIGSPNTEDEDHSYVNNNVKRIKSRLSRNLNTGDRIVFVISAFNESTQNTHQLIYSGLVRWWTKAN